MLKKLINAVRQLVDLGTCHHTMYLVLAAVYAAAEVQLCDKALVGQVAMFAYFTMSLRP